MPLNTLRTVGARMFLNKYFEDFGEVTDVSIDPKANLAILMVKLRGESTPLRLEIDYRVEPEHFVTVHFHCEREWLTNALNRFLANHRFEIDNSVAQALLGILL
ncbi:MAG: hypothetical protein K0S46_2506 [Moraxellaceae bacterium]|jgi:hypothetical protein|nr:hypothetical protein [Moraxellaceae bacterium]